MRNRPVRTSRTGRWCITSIQARHQLVSVSLALIASTSTLSFSALGPILFLGGNESQTTAVLPDDPGSLDALVEPPQKLFKAFVISNFDTHIRSSPPFRARGLAPGIIRAKTLPPNIGSSSIRYPLRYCR